MSTTTTPPAGLEKHKPAALYDRDTYSWSVDQAGALRRRDYAAVDWDNVIEEIESVGRSEEHSWTSHCARAIRHLLKIEHCREAALSTLEGWEGEVQDARGDMSDVIVNNRGLQSKYPSMFASAWRTARRKACRELAQYDVENKLQSDKRHAEKRRNLMLPRSCPYRFEDVTAFELKRGDKNPQHDPDRLPPQVAQVLEERRNRSQDLDWSR